MEKYIFELKDGRELVIRKAEEKDAEIFLQYFNTVGAVSYTHLRAHETVY